MGDLPLLPLQICLSLLSMLASNTSASKPPGDQAYCARVGNASPKCVNCVCVACVLLACVRCSSHGRFAPLLRAPTLVLPRLVAHCTHTSHPCPSPARNTRWEFEDDKV